jgi:predicted O-methyltransferase YrrM
MTPERTSPVTLRSTAVTRVLERLYARSAAEDEPAKRRVRDRETELGTRLSQEQRYELYGEAPLAIEREVGELLHLLTLTRRPRTAIEFGSSHGISTLYLASALRDCGGTLITTELLPTKARITRENLIEAGVDDHVDVRVGDARDTLGHLDHQVDMVFLDGRNDLYLDVLRLLEPQLASTALIAADLNVEDPDLRPYLQYVRDPVNGYLSVEIPLDAGVELSVRVTSTSTHPAERKLLAPPGLR